jgi:hypothetical protein
VAVFVLSHKLVTVIVAVPGATGVTTPLLFTVATEVSEDDHDTKLRASSFALTVAMSVAVSPPSISGRLL